VEKDYRQKIILKKGLDGKWSVRFFETKPLEDPITLRDLTFANRTIRIGYRELRRKERLEKVLKEKANG